VRAAVEVPGLGRRPTSPGLSLPPAQDSRHDAPVLGLGRRERRALQAGGKLKWWVIGGAVLLVGVGGFVLSGQSGH